jgi:hypothetical protein
MTPLNRFQYVYIDRYESFQVTPSPCPFWTHHNSGDSLTLSAESRK